MQNACKTRRLEILQLLLNGEWRVIEWKQAGKPKEAIAQFVNKLDAELFVKHAMLENDLL